MKKKQKRSPSIIGLNERSIIQFILLLQWSEGQYTFIKNNDIRKRTIVNSIFSIYIIIFLGSDFLLR